MKKKNFPHIKVSNVFCIIALLVIVFLINWGYFKFNNVIINTFSAYQTKTGQSNILNNDKQKKLAIIIDDLGQNRDGVREMMSIDRHLTFAVMPFLTFTNEDATTAHNKGYEVILHLPLGSQLNKRSWLGPKPILSVMNDNEVQEIVIDSINNIPYAIGVNIHMGSQAGDDKRIMSDILDIVKENNMYFVDSRASKRPVAKQIADQKGILCYDRDIFLDSTKSVTKIKKQLESAGEIAIKKGFAIAIGHVGSEGGRPTAKAILETLPYYDENNIKLCFISELNKN